MVLLIVLILFIALGLYNPLSVTRIHISSDKIDVPVRIALVSDLHSCRYGDQQKELIDAINQQAPDLICLTGDIFDDALPNDNTEIFLLAVSVKYPCYYVTGNHEFWAGEQGFQEQMRILDQYGVTRLCNDSREIEVNGQKISICGADDPVSDLYTDTYHLNEALADIKAGLQSDAFTLLLSHRPERFSSYTEYGFDLTLCGHAHGGQWRIPFILEGGLYAPNQGMFPTYTGGLYTSGDTRMVVSRGLARESTRLQRFYNRPEIVIIEID